MRIPRKTDGLDHLLNRRQPKIKTTDIDRSSARLQPSIQIQDDRIKPLFRQSELLSVTSIEDKPPPNLPQPGDGFLEPVRLDAIGLGCFSVDR